MERSHLPDRREGSGRSRAAELAGPRHIAEVISELFAQTSCLRVAAAQTVDVPRTGLARSLAG